MYQTILVATDGSETAEQAVDHAVSLAEATGATVHVLMVIDTTADPMRFGVEDVAEIEDAVSDLAADLVSVYEDSSTEIKPEIRRGRPATVILDHAAEIDADLIVAGQRGGNSLKRAILGSTTDRLARETAIPLTVVPAEESGD
jgi:nucleotide-binding universal stress UspA family protein